MLDGDLVAEEPRRARAGVGDQRLFLVEFQLEIISQEPGQALPDLFGLGFGPGEPEEVVICLCRLLDYAESLVKVLARAVHLAEGSA